jgi:hypothetical protein
VIDGIEEKHCRRIRIEQSADDGIPIVTLELYARSVTIAGHAGEVLELAGATDDGDEIVSHNYGPGQTGIVRHLKRDMAVCHLCTPRAIGER